MSDLLQFLVAAIVVCFDPLLLLTYVLVAMLAKSLTQALAISVPTCGVIYFIGGSLSGQPISLFYFFSMMLGVSLATMVVFYLRTRFAKNKKAGEAER